MRYRIFSLLALLVTIAVTLSNGDKGSKSIEVTDDNWAQILEGEWMIKFFAPWCPACRNLQPAWADFASWSADLGINVGHVDVTLSPGLGGRFMIAALPTIYHVKDGIFRQYKGARSKEEFLSFVEEHKWQKVDPISAWSAPNSIHMSVVSQFYRMSLFLRNVMTEMTNQYGLPVWGTYLIFGGLTVLTGLLLGLFLVCLIDFVYLPARSKLTCSSKCTKQTAPASQEVTPGQSQSSGTGSSDEGGEGESEPEPSVAEEDKDKAASTSPKSATARKRRPVKLD